MGWEKPAEGWGASRAVAVLGCAGHSSLQGGTGAKNWRRLGLGARKLFVASEGRAETRLLLSRLPLSKTEAPCVRWSQWQHAAAEIGRLASQTRDDDELLVWARAGACGERAVRPVGLENALRKRKRKKKEDERENGSGASFGEGW